MTPLPSPLGHETLLARLRHQAVAGSLPSSVLLHGPAGVGKQQVALWLAKVLVCADPNAPCDACQHCRLASAWQHPDIQWVFPRPRLKDSDPSHDDVRADLAEAIADRAKALGLYAPPSGTEGIFVSTVRTVVHGASSRPALAARRVIVVGDAERMVAQEGADQAANAFLKLLEEPPPGTHLVLTSSEPGALLPTIRSRVVAFRVGPVAERDVRRFLDRPGVRPALAAAGLPADDASLLAFAGGAPGALLAGGSRASAVQAARAVLAAATGPRSAGFKAAFQQGASGARGEFTDVLDALTDVLADSVRRHVNDGRPQAADAARAVLAVEAAKADARQNAQPSLLMARLLPTLASVSA
jgi:DNA polymerase III subunit delta'